MKKIVCVFLINIFLSSNFFSQSGLSLTDVFSTHKIIFYGYDFSRFHYADGKRYGQDLKMYIFKLIGSLQENIGEPQLKKWMNKDTVVFNFDESTRLNKTINNEAVIVTAKTLLPEDLLQKHLNSYTFSEKSGIGHLILPESFDDLTGSLSVYSIFFDIATKQILLVNWAAFNDVGHINRFTSLKKPMINIIEYLDKDVYREKKAREVKSN